MKKQGLHTKRIQSMQTETLIKKVTTSGQSEWTKSVNRMAEELNVKDEMTVMSKERLESPFKKTYTPNSREDRKRK